MAPGRERVMHVPDWGCFCVIALLQGAARRKE